MVIQFIFLCVFLGLYIFEIQCIVHIYDTTQFELVTFYALNSICGCRLPSSIVLLII